MTVAVILFALVTAAAAGYRIGWRAGRNQPAPRPRTVTFDQGQVRIISNRAFDWETDG